MQHIKRSAIVPFSAQKMFDLVNDVQHYPDFLPWCMSSIIEHETQSEMVAKLTLAKGGVKKQFTTRNQLVPHNEINMELIEGPFDHFEGCWRFEPLQENACKISLDMAFSFSGRLTTIALSAVFNQVANALVDAFCQRAHELYQSE